MNNAPGIRNSHRPGLDRPVRSGWQIMLRRFLGNRLAVAGAIVVLVVSFVAVIAPLLPLDSPSKQHYDAVLVSPGLEHPLGTDILGRDTLSRLIHGARNSLAAGLLSQLIVLAVAIPIGLTAGFGGTRVDNLFMRGVDIVYAFPDLLLMILLRAVFGSSLFMMIMAIGLASWPSIARLIRGQTLSLKEREFVLAARATGTGGTHIALRHVLPNILGPVTVAVAFLIPKAIFAEAALSYIGIGLIQPSWGSMVREGYSVIFAAYEPVLFPVLAIALVMLAFTFLGDGLRDLLDPRASTR